MSSSSSTSTSAVESIATLTAQPRRITVDGETYAVHPLSFDDYGAMQAWVDGQFPNPFDVVNTQIELGKESVDDKGNAVREPYTMAQQQFLYRIAMEMASQGMKLLGTPVADEKVRSMAGTKHLMVLSIRKGDPTFDDARADALFRKMTLGDIARVFAATEMDMVLSAHDPKAPTPSGAETTTPTTETRSESTGIASSTSS